MIEAAELEAMRATSQTAMPDTCTIVRLDYPSATLNTSTGLYEPGAPTTVYAGSCRIRPAGGTNQVSEHGDTPTTVTGYVVTVPHDAGPFAIGDIVSVGASDDPNIADRSFRVTDSPAGSWQIDQRLACEEVTDRG